MGKVTIHEIANKLIAQNGLSKKESTLFVNMMFDLIREALERDKTVKVKGFGTFKIIDVESRESVNVNTGERVLIGGHNKITFTPDVFMKELVNKPFSQFETVVLNDGVDFKDSKEKEVSDADESENEKTETPLVDFIAPDPIDLGAPVEPEKPIAPIISEIPVNPETTVIPENPVVPETPAISETLVNPETPEISETPGIQEAPTEPVTENPVLPEEPIDESSVEGEDVEEEEEEEIPTGGIKWVIVLLASLISLLVGYLLGNYFPWDSPSSEANVPQTEEVVEVAPVKKTDAKNVAKPSQLPEEKAEAPAEETAPSADVAKPATEPAAQSQPEAVKQPEATKQQPAPAEENFERYEAMDARVRTGAYRIVGLDYKEKVREGDNIRRIAKRTLGPDMECYIEVYNGLTATSRLTPGQEINIPKLKWKVKMKAPKK